MSREKNFIVSEWIGLVLRGMLMGVADLLPGVSGGTMALLTGIYPRFIAALAGLRKAGFLVLRGKIFQAWKMCDGWLLFSLACGIVISLALFSHLIKWLLENHRLELMSFFAGLVIYTALHLLKMVKKWNALVVIFVIAGFALAFFLREGVSQINAWAFLPSSSAENISNLALFIGGALAICAMMLPGISGSLLLLLLGLYQPVIEALTGLRVIPLGIFCSGIVVGLLVFAPFLRYSYHNYQKYTVAFLAGLTFGALRETVIIENTMELSTLPIILMWAIAGIIFGKLIDYGSHYFTINTSHHS